MADVSKGLTPRDPGAAKRLVVVLTAAASVLSVVFAVLAPSTKVTDGPLAVSVGCPAIVLAIAIFVACRAQPPVWVWFGYPAIGVTAIVVSDLASRDASVTGQLFFFFPVLFASCQLGRRPAIVLCATAVVGELLVTGTELTARIAFLEGSYVAVALITVTAVLIYSGERIDKLVARLHEQAAIDPLTGLVTRRMLDLAVASSLHSAADDGGTALILIDLDNFKSVNDEHGHLAGDLVLKTVCNALRSVSRPGDVVSRMGGDELAVLLPACPVPAAIEWAGRVLEVIRALRIDVGAVTISDAFAELHLTASMGIAHLPSHSLDVFGLYKVADQSLYEAKRAGRDRLGVPVAGEDVSREAA